MLSRIHPHQWVAIRLPSDTIKVEQMVPNTTISLGKFGSFKTNAIINRPFYITWEILEKSEDRQERALRIVKVSELNANTLLEEAESEIVGETAISADIDDDNELLSSDKSNANIFDDPSNQKLTMQEIEALKADDMANPQDLIARLMASHSTLDRKTAFSLAKYMLRKQKKYMKRFTILPLDVATMTDWMMSERDFMKVMEIRNEMIGLIGSWSNVHAGVDFADEQGSSTPQSRYLVVDDTGGLVVAAVAERMGILHQDVGSERSKNNKNEDDEGIGQSNEAEINGPAKIKLPHRHQPAPLPKSNTIHLVHSNQQPNLSLLRYFNFDSNITPTLSDPNPHPLHTHLKTVSWLQLVDPMSDTAYQEPPIKSAEEIHEMKSNARSTYHRKRRRWERCRSIVDETRAGGFNGLIIASFTNALSILNQLVPLLTGGAQIVIYHPCAEPLMEVFDAYSTARRTAFLNLEPSEREEQVGSSRFPVDPTLTLGFTLHTARVRRWQVLPGRTHPLMTSRGGAEGYVAVATRVLPIQGKIQARGAQNRRGKRTGNGEEPVILENGSIGEQNSSSEDEQSRAKRLRIDTDQDEVEPVVGESNSAADHAST